MLKRSTFGVISFIVVSIMALASCGGTAMTGMVDESNDRDLTYAAGPLVSETVPTDRELSDWSYEIEYKYEIDYVSLLYQLMYQGTNDLDLYNMLSHNEGTYTAYNGVLNELNLNSEPGEMGYALFGLRGIPDGMTIKSVRIWGEGYFGTDETDGLYIGLSNIEDNAYEWVGPYQNDDEWVAYTTFMDTVNDAGRSKLVLAVYDGDRAGIYRIQVTVGLPFEFPEYEIPLEYERVIGPDPVFEGLPFEFLEDLTMNFGNMPGLMF